MQQILGQKIAFPTRVHGCGFEFILIAQEKELLTDTGECHVETILVEKQSWSAGETEKYQIGFSTLALIDREHWDLIV